MTNRYLAFDLGAESGRAILGQLNRGVLSISEIHRFPNEPVRYGGGLHWDIARLWLEMQRGFDRLGSGTLDSIGVDTWGCDYALVGERGHLLENPFSYRDSRTDGVMQEVNDRLGADTVYQATGIQFLAFNTLYQLYAAQRATPRLIDAAQSLATIPDLLNFWLTGRLQAEYTNATTTAMVDARARAWATDLLERLDLPTRLLLPLVEPGAVLGGLTAGVFGSHAGTPVIAPACHDTASAVASVEAGGTNAFLSSGTWSLLGTELSSPIVSARTRELNFTNEGGVCGTTRLLEEHRRPLAPAGVPALVGQHGPASRVRQTSWPRPATSRPHSVPCSTPTTAASCIQTTWLPRIGLYCRQTGQPEPTTPAAYRAPFSKASRSSTARSSNRSKS